MYLTPYASLKWAFQLHYYLGFQTHRRKESFVDNEPILKTVIEEICNRHEYHLLESKELPDQLRSLLSLRPDQAVAKAVQTIKSNSSREWGLKFKTSPPLWAKGYLAQSVGDVRLDVVSKYLDEQSAHHGYETRVLTPVFRFTAEPKVPLTAAHSFFNLSHHVVLATKRRHGVFDSKLGQALVDRWLKVAGENNFAIDKVSVVPDHVHSLVRIVPNISIQDCVLLLMNDGQEFVGRNSPQVLIEAGIDQLWQPSAYVGTCGKYSTGLLQKFLAADR